MTREERKIMQKENEELKKENEELKKFVESLREKIKEANQIIRTLDDKNQRLMEKFCEKHEDSSFQKARIIELQDENIELRRHIDKLERREKFGGDEEEGYNYRY